MPPPIPVEQLISLLKLLEPDKLLLNRSETGLDKELHAELAEQLIDCFDPERRLATLEYLLLSMHTGYQVDAHRYLSEIFLPFCGARHRLRPQIKRITAAIGDTEDLVEGNDDDAAHCATNIYRPLVADVLDPYLTLLVATYQLIEGEFVDFNDANFGQAERQKAGYIRARIKQTGGPADLLDGYDPVVRNALSHSGTDGVIYEAGAVIFRDIRRGRPHEVKTVRWPHQSLQLHIVALLELVMSIDVACEVFGIDKMDNLTSEEMMPFVAARALDPEQRRLIAAHSESRLASVRDDERLSLEQRRARLGGCLFEQFKAREMVCLGLRYGDEETDLEVRVVFAAATTPEKNEDVACQTMPLLRYLTLARSVFGRLAERVIAEVEVDSVIALVVEVPVESLDQYNRGEAGLTDLLGDARIETVTGRIGISVDPAWLAEMEAKWIGPPLPRRGRFRA